MNIKQFFILTACFTLFACSGGFSKGVKKDLTTGLSASYNGFTLSDIHLMVDGKKVNSNKIPLGKKVTVVVEGLDYFAVENGKVYPGCTIMLTDKTGKELLNLPDAFESLNNGTSANEASTLNADLNTGDPMAAGETYLLKVRFFDKHKKENEINAQVDLVVTAP